MRQVADEQLPANALGLSEKLKTKQSQNLEGNLVESGIEPSDRSSIIVPSILWRFSQVFIGFQ